MVDCGERLGKHHSHPTSTKFLIQNKYCETSDIRTRLDEPCMSSILRLLHARVLLLFLFMSFSLSNTPSLWKGVNVSSYMTVQFSNCSLLKINLGLQLREGVGVGGGLLMPLCLCQLYRITRIITRTNTHDWYISKMVLLLGWSLNWIRSSITLLQTTSDTKRHRVRLINDKHNCIQECMCCKH